MASPERRATGMRRGTCAALLLLVLVVPGRAGAFIYPEHRDIMAEGLRVLPPDQQGVFGELWAAARTGRESRYCTTMVDGDGRNEPTCIDLAGWPAIAGDHAWSPYQVE